MNIFLIILGATSVFLIADILYTNYRKKQFNIDLYRNFSIQQLQSSNRYYPKHGKKFIEIGYGDKLTTDITRAKHFPTEHEAIIAYERYLELCGYTSHIYKPKITKQNNK